MRSVFQPGVVAMVVAVVVAAASPVPARADAPPTFRVIVHPENPARVLGRELVAELFLKRRTRWANDEVVAPVDQAPRVDTRARFSQAILGRSVSSVRRYWTQLVFSGRGVPPPELDGDKAVVAYVLSHRGAIGYVSTAADLGTAKVIRIE